MRYKLIAADMDGTLLNSESQITRRTIYTAKKAMDAGVLFVVATGRSMRGVEFVNEQFDKDMPFIIFNGASVMMGKSKKVLFNKFLDVDLAMEVYELGQRYDLPIVLWTDKHLWVNRVCGVTERYSRYSNTDLNIITDIGDLAGENIYKLFWVDTVDNISQHQSVMQEHFKERINCHSSRPDYLEFVSPEAGKGGAMAELGRVYGIDRSEMIAVGDGYNDLSMLEYAGLGIAMGNAPDNIKAACQDVTLTNNEDGVAAAIEKHVLG